MSGVNDLASLTETERRQVLEWLRAFNDGFADDGRWMHVANVFRRLLLAEPIDVDSLAADRDRWKTDAERLAAAWHELLAFYPEACSLDELTEYLHSGDTSVAAHDALTAETEAT